MRVDTVMYKDKKLLQSIRRGLELMCSMCKLYSLNALLRKEKDLLASLSSKKGFTTY